MKVAAALHLLIGAVIAQQRFPVGDPRCEPKLANCTLNELDVICTCDGVIESKSEVTPVVLYITPLVDDDGIVFYYDQTRAFLETFMIDLNKAHSDWPEWLHVRLVHHAHAETVRRRAMMPKNQRRRNTKATPRDAFKCYEGKDDYKVTEIRHQDLRELMNDAKNAANFKRFFAKNVPDLASSCEAFAYDAMYKDLNAFKRQTHDVIKYGNTKALQFTIQPFSIHYSARLTHDALYGPNFQGGPNSAYQKLLGQCNRDDMFVDSALVFSNGDYENDEWVDALGKSSTKANRFAWTELLKCVISEATNDAPNKLVTLPPDSFDCSDYTKYHTHYSDLTDHEIRKSCPMIPNRDQMDETTKLIQTLAKDFVITIDNEAPYQGNEYQMQINAISKTWETTRETTVSVAGTIPDSHICYYDIILALDMDCVAYNENIEMFDLANLMIDDIFARFETDRNIITNYGAIRLGVVGFTNELIIQMNLFEMSSLDGRQEAHDKAKKAILNLRDAQLSRQSNKSHFLHVFGLFSRLFDARNHKVRELVIVSNMVVNDLESTDWSQHDLAKLRQVKDNHFRDTNIRTIAVNEPCQFNRNHREWHEDCSYFKAFAVIEDDASAKAEYTRGTRPVLVPSARSAPYTARRSRTDEFRDFYDDILDNIDADLSDINLQKCRVEPPAAVADCGCASTAHVECHLCEIGGAGPPGPQGPDGEQGPPGPLGLMGSCGEPGLAGNPGVSGYEGIPGIKGKSAPNPPTPRDGAAGPNGSDGSTGLPGTPGNRGLVGMDGPPGRRGSPGPDGSAGLQGGPGEEGLDGEEGQDGPTGQAGLPGPDGLSAQAIDFGDLAALKADMKLRLKKAAQDPVIKMQVKAMSQRFIGTGNYGKSFCECTDCDQPICAPLPPPVCPECEDDHNVVVALDNSNSVKKTVNDQPQSVYYELNDPGLVLSEDDGLYANNEKGNVMFVRFASRLQTDAVIQVHGTKNVTYHDFTTWRDNGAGQLPPRRTNDYKITDHQDMTLEQASNKLELFGNETNAYGELVDTMERTWAFHDDTGVNEWSPYTEKRRLRANTPSAEGSTYFYSMLHDLTQVMDEQNKEKPGFWKTKDRTHLYVYTDFVYFHDDAHDWKLNDAKIMCDVEQCKNTPAKELLNGDYNECANMDVLPGESSTELEEYQICQIMERVNRHFDMIHIVPSTDRIHDKLLCKTKLMNMRINDTCHESFALPPSFIHLEDKSIRDGWKPIICAASIEITIPAHDSLPEYSGAFEKVSRWDELNAGHECKYRNTDTNEEFYYAGKDFGWVIVNNREVVQRVTNHDDNRDDNCCPEKLSSREAFKVSGTEIVVSPTRVPFRGDDSSYESSWSG